MGGWAGQQSTPQQAQGRKSMPQQAQGQLGCTEGVHTNLGGQARHDLHDAL